VRRIDGDALELGLRRPTRLRDLHVADDLVPVDRDEDATGVEVRVQLRRGILGELEQASETCPRAGVLVDDERTGGLIGARHGRAFRTKVTRHVVSGGRRSVTGSVTARPTAPRLRAS
jgi:hypothetical protein